MIYDYCFLRLLDGLNAASRVWMACVVAETKRDEVVGY